MPTALGGVDMVAEYLCYTGAGDLDSLGSIIIGW
jgi:hypothetical protein